jgi:hypothetical protein
MAMNIAELALAHLPDDSSFTVSQIARVML